MILYYLSRIHNKLIFKLLLLLVSLIWDKTKDNFDMIRYIKHIIKSNKDILCKLKTKIKNLKDK